MRPRPDQGRQTWLAIPCGRAPNHSWERDRSRPRQHKLVWRMVQVCWLGRACWTVRMLQKPCLQSAAPGQELTNPGAGSSIHSGSTTRKALKCPSTSGIGGDLFFGVGMVSCLLLPFTSFDFVFVPYYQVAAYISADMDVDFIAALLPAGRFAFHAAQ